MAEPDPEALVAFRELAGEARAGSLSVALNPTEFSALDAACVAFKDAIRGVQVTMQQAGRAGAQWGLGEDNGRLSSAIDLVAKYRELATGDSNSMHAVLEEHYKVAQEMQTLFQVIRDDYIRTDEEFAAKWREMNTEIESGPR
ncbi:hypothetical protein [Antrihabitans stalactiti]|uniref:Uncharacterized protein n=1 Tax=Antrihabitans stalactiti TaxID=2584121 RepID=A0A848KJ22_9NOCA|nr:hypothetical protein [Antrihabitans stalactiti]NMN97808.1 hypothetical protein [Antrihabitans stalactiti]